MTMLAEVPITARQLGLFRESAKRAQALAQPRDNRGRFVAGQYTNQRLKVREVARALRQRLGLPPASILDPLREEHQHAPSNRRAN